jgi:hypothetical protein
MATIDIHVAPADESRIRAALTPDDGDLDGVLLVLIADAVYAVEKAEHTRTNKPAKPAPLNGA